MRMITTITIDKQPEEIWSIYDPLKQTMHAGWYTTDKGKFQASMYDTDLCHTLPFDPTLMKFPTREDLTFSRVLIPMVLIQNNKKGN